MEPAKKDEKHNFFVILLTKVFFNYPIHFAKNTKIKISILIKQSFLLAAGEKAISYNERYTKTFSYFLRKFLDYLINSLIKSGIKKVLFLVGYKYEKIVNRYKHIKNINVEFSIGETYDRTGKRLV